MRAEQVAGGHRSRAEVEDLLREYAASGLGRREFCFSCGVGVSTLSYYLKRSRLESTAPQQQFVAVELCSVKSELHGVGAKQAEGLVEQARGSSRVEREWTSGLAVLLPRDRRIEVQRGFDAGVLEQLVRILERA